MQEPAVKLNLRMPIHLKDWLAQQAQEHGRSQNSELVQILLAAKRASGS